MCAQLAVQLAALSADTAVDRCHQEARLTLATVTTGAGLLIGQLLCELSTQNRKSVSDRVMTRRRAQHQETIVKEVILKTSSPSTAPIISDNIQTGKRKVFSAQTMTASLSHSGFIPPVTAAEAHG